MSTVPSPAADAPVAATEYGAVRGARTDGLSVFRGIPYAAPPVGPLRFRPPQPPTPWTGERDATRFGPVAPQAADPLEPYAYAPAEVITSTGDALPAFVSEDCLALNVWTPAVDDGARPVMVFVHGGAFVVGTTSNDWYTGEHLARRDTVVVTFNYRLGVFGYTELGDVDPEYAGSGNNGLRDQIAALEWVRRNIAAFGGDPGNVTVFGESAGSISISALLATPHPERLFDRAIAQSGGPNLVHSASIAGYTSKSVLRAAAAVGVDDLVNAPVERLVEIGRVAMDTSALGDNLFAPYVDGELVLGNPFELVRRGNAAGIELVAGATQDEMSYWSLYDSQLRNLFVETTDGGPPTRWLSAELRERLDAALAPATIDDVYAEWVGEADPPRGRRDLDATVLLGQAHDYFMIQPMTRLVEAQAPHAPTYLYRFDWKVPHRFLDAPEHDLGAVHALELPFVFGTLDIGGFVPGGQGVLADPTERARAQQVATSMIDAWTAFARTGDPTGDGPAWPRYDTATRPTMVWHNDRDGNLTIGVVADPDGRRREVWDPWPFPPLGS